MTFRTGAVLDLQNAFDLDLSDAVFSITVINYEETFDTTTGKVTKAVSNTQTTRGIYTGNWTYEVYNTPIEPTDEMLIILQDELNFIPRIGTQIISTQRGTSRVVEIKQDPANITWELRIRF